MLFENGIINLEELIMLENMTGQRFGRWTVLEHLNKKYCVCICDCGTKKSVYKWDLLGGKSVSCGCYKSEVTSSRFTTHGATSRYRTTSEYYIWAAMVQRCTNPKNKQYKDYGGRGINVCEEWMRFEGFLSDMGPKPAPGYSLDRLNNDGDYEPDNVQWSTDKQQANNRRNNRTVSYKGKSMNLRQWSVETGLNEATIKNRLNRGWSIEKTLTTPTGLQGKRYA